MNKDQKSINLIIQFDDIYFIVFSLFKC